MPKPQNDHEELNLQQLTDVFEKLAAKYTCDDTAPMHSPHAVSHFCHDYFHQIFEQELRDQAQAAVGRAIQAGESGEDVALPPIDLEYLIRTSLEQAIIIGVEFGRTGYILKDCNCIEEIGDEVETHLREEGSCGHS